MLNLNWEMIMVDTIISSLITGVVALIVGFWGFRYKTKAEHDGLSNEHSDLENRQINIGNKLEAINATANFLKDEKNKDIGRRETLSKQELDMNKLLYQLTTVCEQNIRQKDEIIRLKEENAKLRQHLMKTQNQSQYNVEDEEL